MSSKNNNQINIPQAREAMDKFKMQAAQEVGVNLQNGYNGHLTSREAGSVGGQMVKKMIEAYEQGLQYALKNCGLPVRRQSVFLYAQRGWCPGLPKNTIFCTVPKKSLNFLTKTFASNRCTWEKAVV